MTNEKKKKKFKQRIHYFLSQLEEREAKFALYLSIVLVFNDMNLTN